MGPSQKEERAILEAVRQGKAPPIIKRQASVGNLPVAAEELLEILVLLTKDPDPTCSEAARQTLAGWPVEKFAALVMQPETSADALAYFASQSNLPPALVPAIATHPNASDEVLVLLAPRLSAGELQQLTADSDRLEERPQFVTALLERSDLPGELRDRLQKANGELVRQQQELPAALTREEEHEAQVKPEEKRERMGLTQKIAQMGVAERIQLALKGSKDERMILIRDVSKAVYRAVLQSPKLSDSEVEAMASMKNIADDALRILAGTRKFMKNYIVVRNLANNPRTPIDVSLGLLNRLTEKDLKFLTMNRNIPETVRTVAQKLHRQRSSARR